MSSSLTIIAAVLGVMACALVAPLLVALYFNETEPAFTLGACALTYGFLSITILLAQNNTLRNLKRVEIFSLLLLAWILFISSALLPFWLTTPYFIEDIIFETISATVTSNSSILSADVIVPQSIVFWRILLQWLGGLLTLISIIIVLAPAGVGGISSQQISVFDETGITEAGRTLSTAFKISLLYTTMTAICAVLLVFSGVPIFDGFCIAFSTLSTGGYLPPDIMASLDKAYTAGFIVALFMLIGATSILWHQMIINRRWHLVVQHRESYIVIISALCFGVFLSGFFISETQNLTGAAEIGNHIFNGIFLAVSLISTTGYELADGTISQLPYVLVCSAILIGGSAFSTAGGLKFYRLMAMLMQSFNELNRLVFPHSIQARQPGEKEGHATFYKSIWSYLIIAILLIWACSAVLSLDDMPYEAALFAAISAFATVGGLYELGWSDGGTWLNYQDMAPLSKLALSATMLLGRLEIIVLFGVFNPTYWNTR